MSVNISVSGVEKIDKVLRGLSPSLTHNLLANVHTIAARPFIERAKLFAPLGVTGNLTRSIGSERESFGKSDALGMVKAGVRRGRYKGNHGHLIEYGTRARVTRAGANRGFVKAHPFVRPAFEQTKTQVERIIAFETGKHIVNYMRANL